MGCCNSKNKVRDVVDDQVIVAGENELSNKNGRKQSISDQLTTDRLIYVKPKDNNRNGEKDESKISKWNGVKLEDVSNSDFSPKRSEAIKELSNDDRSDDKRAKPLVESEKSKDETKPPNNKPADDISSIGSEYGQNKHPNDGEINESEANESDEELENESTAKRNRKSIKGKLLFKRWKVLENRRAYEKRYELSLKRRINSRKNRRTNKLVIKSNCRHKHDPSFEADDEQEIEPKQNEIDYNSKYDSSFESESESESDVKNNDQSLVEADHKYSNQSLSIEKQLEEIMKDLKAISKQMSYVNGFNKFDQTNSQEDISDSKKTSNEKLEKQVKKAESEDSNKNDSKNSQSNCGNNSIADSKAKFESENETKQVIKQQQENQKPDEAKNLNLDTLSNNKSMATPLVKPRTRLITFTNVGDNSTADKVSENVNEKVIKQQQDNQNQKREIGKQDAGNSNNRTNDKSGDQSLLFKRQLEEMFSNEFKSDSKQISFNRSKKRFEETIDVNKYDQNSSQKDMSYPNHSNNNGEKEVKKTEYEDSNSNSNGEIKQQQYIPNPEIDKQDEGNSKSDKKIDRSNNKDFLQILLFKRQLEEIMKESKQISYNRSKKRIEETNDVNKYDQKTSQEEEISYSNHSNNNVEKEVKKTEYEGSNSNSNGEIKQQKYIPNPEIVKQDAGNSNNRTNDKSVDQSVLLRRQLEEMINESKSNSKQIPYYISKKRFEETNGQKISLENISYFNNQTNKNVNKEQQNSQKTDNSSKQEDYRPDLERQVDEWKSLIESLTSNSRLMNYALAKTRTEFKLVKDVGYYLSGCREAKSVTEKAWLVYVWITHNIEYDVENFLSGDYRFCNPQSVLERGLAVCSGYSELYKKLCAQLGVECIEIGGYSKGFGYKIGQKTTREDHAWNAIPLGSDGKLRFIESTWGAGYLDRNTKFVKKFVPYYFAVPAHIFNETHHSESYTYN